MGDIIFFKVGTLAIFRIVEAMHFRYVEAN